MEKAHIAKVTSGSVVRKIGLIIGMWLIPGPILIPIGVYFFYKWKKKKKAAEALKQTEASSSQTLL